MEVQDKGLLYAVTLLGVWYKLILNNILLDKNNTMVENVFGSKGIIYAKEFMF